MRMRRIAGLALLMLGLLVSERSLAGAASPVAKITPSGDAVEIDYAQTGGGRKETTTIPLHRAGAVRYFSAGVGLEERQAVYPPFSLKVVFVAGEREYLTRVGVIIQNDRGEAVASIPAEHVTGPWLFVDLKPGRYVMIGKRDGRADVQARATVVEGRESVALLRWTDGDHQQGAATGSSDR
ncbi:hypothetical protein [Candidatus Nitrospira bockiana]